MIDFHSHILPNMDDGSSSLEASIAMLRAAAFQGITHVVATPHFYAWGDDPQSFLERRDRAEKALRKEMARQDGLPRVLMGAEVAFFRGISHSEFLPQLTIRGKRCILIEMPPAPWPEEYYRELEDIRIKWGVIPIIAHIDRYIGPFRTYGIPRRLARMQVYVQANGSFFLGRARGEMALWMLKADQIHLLGSDCHNMTKRKPNLGPAVDKIRQRLGDAAVRRILKYSREALGD